MKYRLTPLNLLCALLIGFLILFLVIPESMNDTTDLGIAYMIPVILFGILIDFILQLIFKIYKWLFIIQIVFIVLIIWINAMP